MTLNATFRSGTDLSASFASASSMDATIESTVFVPVLEDYSGPYEVTPSGETQTLATTDLHMVRNVTINPIPSNYGLITWNGSTITVS